MSRTVIPFPGTVRPTSLIRPKSRPGGDLYITTSETDGGSWAVIHESASGHTCALLADGFLAFDDAVREARRLAKEYHARLVGDDGEKAIARADLRPSDDHYGDAS
jgi:hypothetical protein